MQNTSDCYCFERTIEKVHFFFVYFTGEMSHHDVLEAFHSNTNVILCNHSNSERGYLTQFKDTLAKLLDDNSVEILLSETDADPLVTY